MKVCLHCKSKFESDVWKCPECSFKPEFGNGFLLFAPDLNHTDEGFSTESFLEIGCGTEFVLADIELRFPKMNCSGSELHAAGLEFTKARVGSAPLIQMDARNIPFQSRSLIKVQN